MARLALLSLITVLATACVRPIETSKFDIPVRVTVPGTETVDLDGIYATVSGQVNQTLRKAYFAGMSISGECDELPQVRGFLHFRFQETSALLGQWDSDDFSDANVAEVGVNTETGRAHGKLSSTMS